MHHRQVQARQGLLQVFQIGLRVIHNFSFYMLIASPKACPAASITATFAYQGNLQFPRVVEELYMVTRHEAFIFHFECFEPYAAKLSNDVDHFYKTFRPRPRRAVTLPKALPSSTTIDHDKVPF